MIYIYFLSLALPVLIIFLICGILFWTIQSSAPFVPSRQGERERIFSIAKIKPGNIIYDLGSGDGRILIEAACRYGAKGLGIEIQPLLVLWSNLRARMKGVRKQVKFIRGNLFKFNLSEADFVFCYLMPKAMSKLKEKFERELKPGSVIICNTFAIKEWLPEIEYRDNKTGPIFLYRMPPKSATN